ncbi:MAG: hypothetical protein H0U89_11875 [Acidimicrobiia bacterium]|nr:hypothetical protein [Acidimicrobiia bacterium]
MERLVDAIADAFRRRDVEDLTAEVVAETAVGVVKVALRRWLEVNGQEPLHTLMTDSLTRLGAAFEQSSNANRTNDEVRRAAANPTSSNRRTSETLLLPLLPGRHCTTASPA